MPVLNATSIPYTGVPTVSTPPDAGGQTQRISADASSFGSLQGAASSQLGRTLESAGDQFAQIAIQRQDIYNKLAATESGNALTDNWSKILTGDPNNPTDHGYYGTTGREAGDKFPEARNKIDTAFVEARSRLQNPQQQLLFDAEMRRQRAYNLGLMGRHYDQEYKKYTEATYTGGIKNAEGGVATAAANNDPNEWERALGRQMQLIIDRGQALSQPQEQVDAALHEARSNAVHIRVATLAAQDHPGDAYTLLENNHDAIGGIHSLAYAQLLSSIKEATSKEQIRAARGTGPMPAWLPPGTVRSGASLIEPSPEVDKLINAAASKYGVDPIDVKALFHEESKFRQEATSPTVARGVGQLTKDTAKDMGVDREDLAGNIEGSVKRYKQMLDLAGGDQDKAIRMYNAGPNGDLSRTEPRNLSANVRDIARRMREKAVGRPDTPRPAEPIPPASRSSVSGIPTNLRAVGDSLSAQLINSGVAGAIDKPFAAEGQPITPGMSAGGSDQPDRILARMKGLPDDFYKGNTIFLTSGSNMPSKIGYVADQIALARAKGAEAVLVPALGPGIKGHAYANQVLRYFAAEKGAIFFEPKIEWDKEGVHPKNATEVAKFRQQGLDALAQAKGPPT